MSNFTSEKLTKEEKRRFDRQFRLPGWNQASSATCWTKSPGGQFLVWGKAFCPRRPTPGSDAA